MNPIQEPTASILEETPSQKSIMLAALFMVIWFVSAALTAVALSSVSQHLAVSRQW